MAEDPASPGIVGDELTGDVGSPDIDVLTRIRDVILDAEPLVTEHGWNDPVDRRQLEVHLSEGIQADRSRFDVTWYTSGAYTFHYVDANDLNWRFDRHPNPHSAEKHFHPPPDADARDGEASCIGVEEPLLVTRAVLKLWRRAVRRGSAEHVNTAENPP